MKTLNKQSESRSILLVAFVSLIFMFSSCMDSTTPLNEVYIKGMAFMPATLTVTTGTSVKWTNKDAVSHTVTSDAGLFDSNDIAPNGKYSHTFSTVGTFNYHCSIHTSMTAKIVVNAPSTMSNYTPPSTTGY